MGKIKTKLIKRTGNTLMREKIDFNEDFEKNKKLLGNEMPSKKIKNQVAGYAVRIKRREKVKAAKIQESIEAMKK